jgi:Tol biopolymer transport system component
MGEVYRARDTRLDRSVAVKVLAQHLALSTEVRQRFEREAKTVSALTHPNICTLYDVGREGDTDYLVMELLEGRSLADRLEEGPLPMEEVLRLGIQIADALEQAHASGIVHRDLKPGNVMLTERGVKLLDFGLAKLQGAAAPQSSVSVLRQMPTEAGTAPLTAEGTLLGTFQYMSPEQLEGREADAASDIFALGAVLYEMATAKKAFSGKSQASLIGAIMHSAPPPVSTLAPLSTPAFDRVVSTCLAKDPRDRWQTAHDVRLQLAWIAEGGSMVGLPAPVAHHRRNRERLAWAAAAALALSTALLAVGFAGRAPEPKRIVRFDIAQPAAIGTMGAPMISPDGRRIAFTGVDAQGKSQIWLRALESREAQPLPGTEGVVTTVRPFWSPDSRHLGYFSNGRLMRIPVDGGPPQKVCDTPVNGGDGTWSEQGVILFDGSAGDPIRRCPAEGGVPREEVKSGEGERNFEVAWPQFLPDGRHYLFIVFGGAEADNGVWVGQLDGNERRKVVDGLSRAEFAPPGSLLFVRESTLVAQSFDPDRAKLVGEPVPLAEGIGISNVGLADFSASRNGVLVYRAGQAEEAFLAWLDLAGKRLSEPDELGTGRNPDLSPDGRWLAFDDASGRNNDIWLRDLKRGVRTRLTTDETSEYAPLFTPDGGRLLFSRDQGAAAWSIVERALDSPAERVVVPPADTQIALAVTPDGRRLLYAFRSAAGQFDLAVTDLAAGGAGKPYAATAFNEFRGSFSPDGRWLAYQSNESGRSEIYVQAFPEPGRKWQISTLGGSQPLWSKKGSTLYFVSADRRLMRVAVTTAPAFDAGVAEALWTLPFPQGASRNKYVMTPDEQRLLAVSTPATSAAAPATVVLDWDAGLRR